MPKDYYVYMVECTNGRLYTGYTVDIKKRFEEHLSGKTGAKFTRAFKPRKISVSWKICGERGDALHVEAFIKSLHRKEKLCMVENPQQLIDRLILNGERKYKISVFDYNASMLSVDKTDK